MRSLISSRSVAGMAFVLAAARVVSGRILQNSSYDDMDGTLSFLPVYSTLQANGALAWEIANDTTTAGPYNGSVHYSNDPTAEVRFRFTGINMFIYGTKKYDRARVTVQIDNNPNETFDQYQAQGTGQNAILYSKRGLENSSHDVTLSNAASDPRFTGNPYIAIDQIIFTESFADNTPGNHTSAPSSPTPTGGGSGGGAGGGGVGGGRGNHGGSDTPIGAIVGGAIGGLVVIGIFVGLFLWWRRKQHKHDGIWVSDAVAGRTYPEKLAKTGGGGGGHGGLEESGGSYSSSGAAGAGAALLAPGNHSPRTTPHTSGMDQHDLDSRAMGNAQPGFVGDQYPSQTSRTHSMSSVGYGGGPPAGAAGYLAPNDRYSNTSQYATQPHSPHNQSFHHPSSMGAGSGVLAPAPPSGSPTRTAFARPGPSSSSAYQMQPSSNSGDQNRWLPHPKDSPSAVNRPDKSGFFVANQAEGSGSGGATAPAGAVGGTSSHANILDAGPPMNYDEPVPAYHE